jgi:hypothetical protein
MKSFNDGDTVTGRKLNFEGEMVVKGPLVKTHFEIRPAAPNRLSEDTLRPSGAETTYDKFHTERQTDLERNG